MLISEKINHAFNEQIGHELGNSHQYLAIATYFERESLFGLAKLYYKQSEEERQHATKFIKFVLDAGGKVAIPAVPAARSEFESAVEAAQQALDSELNTTRQIYDLVALATEEKNYIALNFLQWFVSRAARRGLQCRDAARGDPPRRAQRAHGRGLPGPRCGVSGPRNRLERTSLL